jgi:hypothetical protein
MKNEYECIKQKLEDHEWVCCLIELKKIELERWIKQTKKIVSIINTKSLMGLYLEICENLNAEIKKLSKEKSMVEDAISSIDDCDIKQVMTLKYIECLNWSGIRNITNLPDKECHELHKKGLELLENILSEAA